MPSCRSMYFRPDGVLMTVRSSAKAGEMGLVNVVVATAAAESIPSNEVDPKPRRDIVGPSWFVFDNSNANRVDTGLFVVVVVAVVVLCPTNRGRSSSSFGLVLRCWLSRKTTAPPQCRPPF